MNKNKVTETKKAQDMPLVMLLDKVLYGTFTPGVHDKVLRLRCQAMDNTYNPGKVAMVSGKPMGIIGCPHCGMSASGIFRESICGFCGKPYWK